MWRSNQIPKNEPSSSKEKDFAFDV
jgi:hypothetical protein